MSEHNKQVVRRYFEELDRTKASPVDLVAAGFTFQAAGLPAMDLEDTQRFTHMFFELAVSAPARFTSGTSLRVQASSQSLEISESLLNTPLNAGDLIAPDRGCLRLPNGGISLAGICANVPGP